MAKEIRRGFVSLSEGGPAEALMDDSPYPGLCIIAPLDISSGPYSMCVKGYAPQDETRAAAAMSFNGTVLAAWAASNLCDGIAIPALDSEPQSVLDAVAKAEEAKASLIEAGERVYEAVTHLSAAIAAIDKARSAAS